MTAIAAKAIAKHAKHAKASASLILAGWRLAAGWLAQNRVRIQCVYVLQLNLRTFDHQLGGISSRSWSVSAAVDLAWEIMK
jgi:hypothetical protein